MPARILFNALTKRNYGKEKPVKQQNLKAASVPKPVRPNKRTK